MTTDTGYVKSPAPFTPAVLDRSFELLPAPPARILDPFAGNGVLFHEAAEDRGYDSVGVELEPEFAAAHPRNVVGNATRLRFDDDEFDAVLTSPTYGNRMADLYAGDAKDSKRVTYRIALNRDPSPGSTCGLQWGSEYRGLHRLAWGECRRVLKPGGTFVLNVKDHIRDDLRQRVTSWHVSALLDLGFIVVSADTIKTPGMRFGQNHQARVEGELVIAFELDPSVKDGRML